MMQEFQISNAAIEQKILIFIQDRFAAAQHQDLAIHDLLLEGGLIDSMGFIDLIQFLESEFDMTVEGEELLPENFQSIAVLATFVKTKLNCP
jgi:acyl carrier protein